MKVVARVTLLAVLLLVALALVPMVSAAPIDNSTESGTTAPIPPAAPALAPDAQGCSGTPSIQYAYANPATISPGQLTTLYWGLVGNANAAFLQYPNNNRVGIATPGSQQVNPTQTTTYFIIGVCGNNQAQFPITVNVTSGPTCSGTPQISSFTANPSSIQSGQSSTLQWGIVTNATAVTLTTPSGNGGISTPGSVQVTPGSTTTYTLTAWCNSVSAQAQVTVTVTGQPPPPPPPAQGNQITSIQYNGGLSNSSQMVLTVNYFWNGEDPPAVLQGTAFNSGGQQISQSNATRINANQAFHANLNFQVNPANVTRVNVCIIGSSGSDLVCQSQNK